MEQLGLRTQGDAAEREQAPERRRIPRTHAEHRKKRTREQGLDHAEQRVAGEGLGHRPHKAAGEDRAGIHGGQQGEREHGPRTKRQRGDGRGERTDGPFDPVLAHGRDGDRARGHLGALLTSGRVIRQGVSRLRNRIHDLRGRAPERARALTELARRRRHGRDARTETGRPRAHSRKRFPESGDAGGDATRRLGERGERLAKRGGSPGEALGPLAHGALLPQLNADRGDAAAQTRQRGRERNGRTARLRGGRLTGEDGMHRGQRRGSRLRILPGAIDRVPHARGGPSDIRLRLGKLRARGRERVGRTLGSGDARGDIRRGRGELGGFARRVPQSGGEDAGICTGGVQAVHRTLQGLPLLRGERMSRIGREERRDGLGGAVDRIGDAPRSLGVAGSIRRARRERSRKPVEPRGDGSGIGAGGVPHRRGDAVHGGAGRTEGDVRARKGSGERLPVPRERPLRPGQAGDPRHPALCGGRGGLHEPGGAFDALPERLGDVRGGGEPAREGLGTLGERGDRALPHGGEARGQRLGTRTGGLSAQGRLRKPVRKLARALGHAIEPGGDGVGARG